MFHSAHTTAMYFDELWGLDSNIHMENNICKHWTTSNFFVNLCGGHGDNLDFEPSVSMTVLCF